ncbi:MAG: NUDIX hydrolase [Halobaculum sp.]
MDGYTLRNAAKGLVTCGDRVLLTAERHADGSLFWTLPGGGVESGETFRDCLRRELFEEIRCRVDTGQYVTTVLYHHRSRRRTVSRYAVFDCSLRSGLSANPTDGIDEYALFDPSDLPARTLPQIRQVIQTASGSEG